MCRHITNGILIGTPAIINLDERTALIKNVVAAIEAGEVVPAEDLGLGTDPISLKTDKGINILGNMVEANQDSVNPSLYYGYGIHNSGHNIIGLVVDPDESKGLPPGVMGESSTAMRDTMFYRHHYFVDQLFGKYKKTLAPYKLSTGDWPLLLLGVKINSFKVVSEEYPGTPNKLETYWGYRRFDLSVGLDFNRTEVNGPLQVCTKHLDHHDFIYQLEIERTADAEAEFDGEVTVRIFLAPLYDLKKKIFTIEDVRDYIFVLDTFKITVGAEPGVFIHNRSSTDTPLTIDFPLSLGEEGASTRPFCGCGWPRHLLLPKGIRSGYPMGLFAILTKDEKVDPPKEEPICKQSYIFCGIINGKYTDKRPMGYPFDRQMDFEDTETSPDKTTQFCVYPNNHLSSWQGLDGKII